MDILLCSVDTAYVAAMEDDHGILLSSLRLRLSRLQHLVDNDGKLNSECRVSTLVLIIFKPPPTAPSK